MKNQYWQHIHLQLMATYTFTINANSKNCRNSLKKQPPGYASHLRTGHKQLFQVYLTKINFSECFYFRKCQHTQTSSKIINFAISNNCKTLQLSEANLQQQEVLQHYILRVQVGEESLSMVILSLTKNDKNKYNKQG